MYLADGPRTVEEISEHYQSYLRFFGMFNLKARLEREGKKNRINDKVRQCLEQMIADGWVVASDDRYRITDAGKIEAEKNVN